MAGARSLGLQPLAPELLESRAGRAFGRCTGRHEGGQHRLPRQPRRDGDRDRPTAHVGGGERAAIVLRDHVQDDPAVRRVVGVAVRAPAARAQVQFDVTAELGAVELHDGVTGVGPVTGRGHAWEADAQAAPVLNPGEAAQACEPALGQGRLAARCGRAHASAPGGVAS